MEYQSVYNFNSSKFSLKEITHRTRNFFIEILSFVLQNKTNLVRGINILLARFKKQRGHHESEL